MDPRIRAQTSQDGPPCSPRQIFGFGAFELDARSSELRKDGLKIRLADQPLRILLLLLERPGEIVTRDEIRQRLWSADTFVDFDVGLGSAVHKLREALGDSAENPQFIQTLPRRGYRFIAPVKAAADDPMSGSAPTRVSPSARLGPKWIAGGLALAVMAAGLMVYQRGWWDPARTGAAGTGAGSPAERHPLGRRTIDPAAYDAYMKGVSAAGLQTTEGFRNAVAYFEDAVAKQPDFAMAYASLGQAQLQFLWAGPLSPRETVPKSEAATRKALQLDDALPLAHRTLAQILQYYYWHREDAEKELHRARELEKDPAAFSTMELIESGQFALAIAQAERARRLDPLSFNAAINVGSAFRAAGQYDRAIAEYRRALDVTPRRPRGHFQLGVTFVAMERWKDAIDELETAVRLSSGNSRFEAYLAYAYAAEGRRADARRILKGLQSRARHEYVSSFGIALIYDALGDRKPALAALEQAYQEHAIEFAQAHQYPPFQSLRADPRYQAVMQRFVRNP